MTASTFREPRHTPADHTPADHTPAGIAGSAGTAGTMGTAGSLAGTFSLVRFILRRDRMRLSAWLLGLTMLLYFFLSALSDLAATAEQRRDLSRFMDGTVGALFGPGYGRHGITAERYLVGVYGLFFFILAAVMCMLLVARHTRLEEQNGRAELVRSNVVGRHAPLTAALVVAVGTNVVLALLLGGTLTLHGFGGGDGMLFGASVGAVGLAFAGVTALTVQVTEYSRAAIGMTGAVFGVAWVTRVAGDMVDDYGSPLSWASPLAWSNQTRPYVDGRWWPLLFSVGLATVAAAAGYVLSARRDVGAGLVTTSTGKPAAAPWLRSPLTAAFRLQRSGLASWTVALTVFGFLFGALGDQIADPEGMSDDRLEMFGGSLDTLVDGYLGVITLVTAALAGIMVVLVVQAMRVEETRGRAEPVLATATSRAAWFCSYLAVAGAGLVGLLVLAGFATGLSAAVSTGDSSYIGELMVAHLAHAPGVLVLLGGGALLFGVLPRAFGAAWGLLGASLFVGIFGPSMDLPQGLRNLLPMEHTGQPPLDSIAWPATTILLILAAGLVVAGLVGFSRRDLESR